MRKATVLIFVGLSLVLCPVSASFAQTPTPAAPNNAAPRLSADSLVGDLVKDPDAKAVLTANIPEVMANPQLTMGYGMKLRDIAQFEPTLTPEKLGKIDKDLAAMQAKRGH